MLGVILAATAVLIALRFVGFKTMFGMATPVDMSFGSLMIWMFHGTLAGMTGAATGGLLLAAFLSLGRYVFGYNTVRRNGWRMEKHAVPSPLGGWFKRWWQRLKGVAQGQAQAAMQRAAS